jgi:integrase
MDRRQRLGVRARGSSIQLDFQYKGVRCRETLKIRPTAANLRFAQRKRETILYEIETGTFRYSEHFPKSRRAKRFGETEQITVSEALDRYLSAKLKSCEPSTYRSYKSAVAHHLRPTFGSLRLAELTTAAVQEWIASLAISNKRINNVLIPLRGICAASQELEPQTD